jgi:UDP-4-amino-4-deoxy-L-arabinose-oxoglutarate aminotransferase
MCVPFFRHDLGREELQAIERVFAGPILTTGDVVAEFEGRFAQSLGVPHVVGVTSCTAAMQLAMTALGIGPGDEVVTTPMTFIATATAILQAGATPVFVDVEPTTGNIDVDRLESAITPKTRAILPVHLYGLMCDMRAIRSIADRHGLRVIEDAAHCVEGGRDGVGPGSLADAVCFSFYATKTLTCGEGGAVAVHDRSLAERLRLLRTHGMTKTAVDREREGYSHWDMVEFGWKYNMDNIQAAMLLPQLDRLDSNHRRRLELADRYTSRLCSLESVELPATPDDAVHARHLFPVWVDPTARDSTIEGLARRGVGAVVNYRPVHLTSWFRQRYGYQAGMFPIAESIGERTLSLPLYPTMPTEHVEIVCDALEEIFTDRPLSR